MSDLFSNLGYYLALALVFVVMISVLVAAHELGHYWFARLFGMGVEEFAIGFGKKPIWTWMRKTYPVQDDHHPEDGQKTETTDFTVRPWPLGGFVRIKGMVPMEDGSEVDIPGGFYNKAPWQRFIVLLAGPMFSVIAGILVLIPLYSIVGVERLANEPVLGKIPDKDKPAYVAGLRTGDHILEIDGQPVHTFYDMLSRVRVSAGKTLNFKVERGGQEKTFPVTPVWSDSDTPVLNQDLEFTGELRRQAIIGVGFPDDTKFVPLPLPQAVTAAANEPVRAVRSLLGLVSKPKNFDKTVSGPATMVAFTNYALQRGIATILKLAALLSISVGLFNLLPFSPLDGGQMVVAVLEMFRRGRRLSIQMQTAISAIGMTLIGMLVLSAWFVDFKRWWPSGKSEKPPIAKPGKEK